MRALTIVGVLLLVLGGLILSGLACWPSWPASA
jgi:hypothetical protein